MRNSLADGVGESIVLEFEDLEADAQWDEVETFEDFVVGE